MFYTHIGKLAKLTAARVPEETTFNEGQ